MRLGKSYEFIDNANLVFKIAKLIIRLQSYFSFKNSLF